MFRQFHLETCSGCNRRCATCLRQTDPAAGRDGPNRLMPSAIIRRVLDQLATEQYEAKLCLGFYNEPLLDPRLPAIAGTAKAFGISFVYICTNGDLLTADTAKSVDGKLDMICVALYDDTSLEKREAVRSLFQKTEVQFTDGVHRVTHYSPDASYFERVTEASSKPCIHAQQVFAVNYHGDCLLCCDELVPHLALGNVRNCSIGELWHSHRRQQVLEDLSKPLGRGKYPYCYICPRM